MSQLMEAHLDWAASFTGMAKDVLKAGLGGAAASAGAAVAAAGKLPSPMLPDCKVVHGKVPGPENHLLCSTHHHVVDVDAKTIIAHSLPEYMKTHAGHGHGHGTAAPAGHATPAQKAPSDGTGKPAGTATPVAAAGKEPPKPEPTKIPTFTGTGKEVFAQECALLETFRPSPTNPEMYIAIVDGKEASIARAQAESILAQVSKQMQTTITNIAQSNHIVITTYEGASAKGLEHIGSGLNKVVSLVKGDGWIHDPGDRLSDLEHQWLAALSTARGEIAAHHFQAAARLIADGEILGQQAEHLLTAFENKVLKNADTTLSVLKHVESTSKSIAKTIATAEFGAAGAAAIDATFAVADVTGEALAGQKIDWAGHVIDLGMDVLMDKYGDQAEAAVKDRVAKILGDRFKGIAKKTAEAIAKKVAKKLVEKGSDFMREELHTAAEEVKKSGEKKATYSDLAKATVGAMQQPSKQSTAKIETAIEHDAEFAALVETHAT